MEDKLEDNKSYMECFFIFFQTNINIFKLKKKMQVRLVIQTPCVSGMPTYLKFLRATRYSCQPQPFRYKEVVEEGLGVILKQCRCVCVHGGGVI